VATRSAHKLRELRQLLPSGQAELVDLGAVGVDQDIPETGATFEANARLKARAYARLTGLPTLADDSGLEVDALGGGPGVRTKRYASVDATDEQNNRKLLGALAGLPPERRGARYVCVLALAVPTVDGRLALRTARGTCRGRIADGPRGSGGFGYDPIFEPASEPPGGATLGQWSAEAKNRISHRAKAARRMASILADLDVQGTAAGGDSRVPDPGSSDATRRGRLGEPLDWEPVAAPGRAVLAGRTVRLEPIDVGHHAASLFAASHGAGADPHLWDYLPYGPFPDAAGFSAWLSTCASSDDPLFLAVVDEATGRALGMASYLRITPAHGVIEIGHIWFSAAMQRTPQATEAIWLLARHVFDDLGYRRLEWKCDALNARSRRAATRLGFTFEGIFRQHLVVKGRNRDTAWYAMLDGEWPAIRAAFESWLAAGNFDVTGRQRRTLTEIRSGR